MLFVIFQWQLNEFVYYLLNLIKFSVKKTITEKILENGKKILEKSGNFVSPEKWEPCLSEQVWKGLNLIGITLPWTEIDTTENMTFLQITDAGGNEYQTHSNDPIPGIVFDHSECTVCGKSKEIQR